MHNIFRTLKGDPRPSKQWLPSLSAPVLAPLACSVNSTSPSALDWVTVSLPAGLLTSFICPDPSPQRLKTRVRSHHSLASTLHQPLISLRGKALYSGPRGKKLASPTSPTALPTCQLLSLWPPCDPLSIPTRPFLRACTTCSFFLGTDLFPRSTWFLTSPPSGLCSNVIFSVTSF